MGNGNNPTYVIELCNGGRVPVLVVRHSAIAYIARTTTTPDREPFARDLNIEAGLRAMLYTVDCGPMHSVSAAMGEAVCFVQSEVAQYGLHVQDVYEAKTLGDPSTRDRLDSALTTRDAALDNRPDGREFGGG
jgi:hypothetical protein